MEFKLVSKHSFCIQFCMPYKLAEGWYASRTASMHVELLLCTWPYFYPASWEVVTDTVFLLQFLNHRQIWCNPMDGGVSYFLFEWTLLGSEDVLLLLYASNLTVSPLRGVHPLTLVPSSEHKTTSMHFSDIWRSFWVALISSILVFKSCSIDISTYKCVYATTKPSMNCK